MTASYIQQVIDLVTPLEALAKTHGNILVVEDDDVIAAMISPVTGQATTES